MCGRKKGSCETEKKKDGKKGSLSCLVWPCLSACIIISVGPVSKARFTQVKFFNGYPSNYIFKISFRPTISVKINVKLIFHLHLVMSRIYLYSLIELKLLIF